MTLVLRTTDCPAEPTVLPALPTGTDSLLQLESETQRPSGPGATRCLNHPRELALRGIPVMCTACRARRDWLLINHGRNVWIVCRCSNQWLEPEISRADFDALIAIPDGTTYPSVEQGLTALGFDGAFAGTYLD
ncbi:hypothetical protein K2224_28875 (plasmid) [Streptomyces sp. BHT-5-2]|uniref:hypothetical protein n=1 Tax=Streptomyces sp. BHT-5-2 TaxID=2866715 RepID=UPI001C8EF84C|nr:hypothetical protein [Streptomyces sp. BHT-5-2]QZL07293.1 hypothetical protein K2224_28875 [Streptomyces sp. BHT-5-2]